MSTIKRWVAALAGVLAFASCASAQPFPTPVAQAIALLTSGTTPFSIVGINADGYINWGTGRSETGYGFRDLSGTLQFKNLGGDWASFGSGGGGGAPADATYLLQTANGDLSSAQVLASLTTGLMKVTATTGVVSTATAGVDYVLPSGNVATATALATPRTIQGVSFDGTANIVLFDQDLDTTDSPTFNALTLTGTFTVSGDLSGGGGSVTDDLTWEANDIGVAFGGTGLSSGTSGGILGYTASGTLASSVALTNHAIVLGAGAGATPTPMASLGTTTTVLHGNASGAPTFGAVNLGTDTTGTVGVAQGGTNLASYAVGDIIYASATTTLSKLADVTAGRYLRSGGVTTAPVWSTTSLPNSATTGDVMYASGANTYANLSDVAAGSYLRSGGTSTAPVWSTTTLPNSATTGDLLYASAANIYSNLAAVATGRVLGSMGTSTAPAWLTDPIATTFEVTSAFVGPGSEASTGVVRLANLSEVNARNAGGSGDITLIMATAGDRVKLGSVNSTGLTVDIGSNQFFVEGTTPTTSAGFGTGETIVGIASAFKVTVGSGGDSSGVVLFNKPWTNSPICMVEDETTSQPMRPTPTTTQITITGTMAASDVISVLCFGRNN